MAKIALWFYTNEGGEQVRAGLINLLQEKGHQVITDFDMRLCFVLNGCVFTEDGINLSEVDIFYHMNADEQTPHQNEVLDALERSGVHVINSVESFKLAKDKFFANQCLRLHNIRVPDAALISAKNAGNMAKQLMKKMGAVVVKPRNKHGGKGILKFSDHEPFADYVSATEDFFDNYYIERYIDFGAHDYRVEIFRDAVIGGYSRTKTHSFKTNVAAGGLMTPQKPSTEFEKIALSAAKAIGVDATIVDLVQEESTGNIFVLEVNPIMGIFVESAITNFNKSIVREIHPVYANDEKKLNLLANYLDARATLS